jgi:ATP-dependent helicase/nuclease subunit A
MNKKLKDQAARNAIENDLNSNFLVEAGAGSGKTYSLVKRFISLVKNGESEGKIAIITFTRKAAAELKLRIQIKLESELNNQKLSSAESENIKEALSNFSSYYIGTIHAFAARILRERPIEAAVDPDFKELSGREEKELNRRSYQLYLNHIRLNQPEELEKLEEIGIDPHSLKNHFVDLTQYPDVEFQTAANDMPDFDLAVREINEFIKEAKPFMFEQEPENGYDKAQQRILKAENIIKYNKLEDNELKKAELLSVFDNKTNVTLNRWKDKEQAKIFRDQILVELREEYIEPALKEWNLYRHRIILSFLQQGIDHFRSQKLEEGKLSFHDLLHITAETLKNNPELRKYFKRKYSTIMVDEFQDTDPLQAEIIFYLTAENIEEKSYRKLRPEAGSLFVVGDPKQSIYRFRRADINIYNQVKKQIEESGGEVLKLYSNFRTVPELTEYLSDVFKDIFVNEESLNQDIYAPLVSVRDQSSFQLKGIKTLTAAAEYSKKDEIREKDAAQIADFIEAAVENKFKLSRTEDSKKDEKADYSDFMIILRYKEGIQQYIKALKDRGIPVDVTGGSTFERSAVELRDLHKILKLVNQPERAYLVGALKTIYFAFDDQELFECRKAGANFELLQDEEIGIERYDQSLEKLKKYYKWKKEYSAAVVLEKIVEDLGVFPFVFTQELAENRASSILYFLEAVKAEEAETFFSFKMLVTRLEELFEDGIEEELDLEPAADAVRILNLHRAKGLEAPVVILADPAKSGRHSPQKHISREEQENRGYYLFKEGYHNILGEPPEWEKYKELEERESEAEEERLLYVAATRAKNMLIVSSSARKPEKSSWHRILKPEAAELDLDFYRKNLNQKNESSREISITELENFRENNQDWAGSLAEKSYQLKTATDYNKKELYQLLDAENKNGMNLGTAAHKLIEYLIEKIKRKPEENKIYYKQYIDKYLKLIVNKYELKESDQLSLKRMINDFLKSELFQELQAAEKAESELAFYLKLDGFNYLNGVIDLALKLDDQWTIIDFKTGRPENKEDKLKKEEAYQPQLDVYSQAWKQINGREPARTELYWLD